MWPFISKGYNAVSTGSDEEFLCDCREQKKQVVVEASVRRSRGRKWGPNLRYLLIFANLILFMFSIVHLIWPSWLSHPPTIQGQPYRDTSNKIYGRKNIWADITSEEATELLHWLQSPHSGLNLTLNEAATPADDIILITELLRPNKTDAIAFLDEKGATPPRFARVTVKRNSVRPPDIAEFMVGPLSREHGFVIEPLSHIYNSGRSATTNPTPDVAKLSMWIDTVAYDAADIINDLLGGRYHGMDGAVTRSFEASSNDQISVENGHVMRWVSFYQISDANTLLPQGLYFKADTTGEDVSMWKVVMWLYNGVSYPSTDVFRQAWQTPGFEKTKGNLDGDWTAIEPEFSSKSEKYFSNPAPEVIQSGGSRIMLDEQEGFVSWMGYSFNFAFSQVNGIALYDIRLDGERVIYELSLQEAMAHYAGNDPIQSNTAFLDSLFGFGRQLDKLVPGYDCPSYAHFFNLSYHRMGRAYQQSGALCIFESPTDYPLQRHSRGGATTVFTNSMLIVRTIAVVGNYDYLLDYIMYLDGTIEVKVRASGYIQGAFYLNNTGYGYRVHEALSSSIHDHVLNFKADLDIDGGTNNSLTRMTVVARDVDYPWSTTGPRHTMVLERSQLEAETALDWPKNSESMYVVTGGPNDLGELRGYRVMPGTGIGTPSHLIVQNSSVLVRAADWAMRDLFVTRQKDTEPRSSVPANALTPDDPLIDFRKFLNEESVIGEDLVIWFNLGTHHVPHTGDIPNTLMTTSASSVMFVPHNYHLRDRSRALTDGVRIDINALGNYEATFFGENNLKGLKGYYSSPKPIRKFPSNDTELAL